ncbi:MAG: pitrilysin family protein [Prevotella bivia]|uniref:M16 family metallopeptidase n=1 Tax=Prevotella bivia TaxID=28125 RepID=UPI000777BFD7|nr:pitrilysin family protein [Prevotella bivia]KXU57509.1 peptidase M16 inactive domain protein [Prevotella bivia]MDK7762898.1 pitrilysin family protein [Prevotella bivia]MDU2113217.1 pitrilysin family protein [Prevotella bivia]MDU2328386.1 pitrilysin family protein [Prevotella bivia]WIL17229.1 pitrilysin family protein [Prevotella bivia]
MNKYNTATLDNGLRIIHLPSDADVVYCGYEINAGTADETELEEGIAHFCEHVTFKGTKQRRSLDIINFLEDVGGDLNAFTTKSETVYYSAILNEHIEMAVDLLSDIVFHSTYPQAEINKEVEVICDEIESYNDSPSELIFDDFENIVFRHHPLGHNILGKAETVRSFTTADALRFTTKHYRPDNAVFYASGNINFDKLVELLQQYTPAMKPRKNAKSLMQTPHYEVIATTPIVVNKDTHQAHVVVGTHTYDVYDKRRMPLYLLNNILGGPGMSARLNLSLREKHGLVYTVESTMSTYERAGLWNIYFGCDPDDVETCLTLIRKELDKVMNTPLTQEELAKAKRQIKGQIGIAADNRESYALDFGKSFLHYGWLKDIQKLYQDIDKITAEEIQAVARELFPASNLTTLIYK